MNFVSTLTILLIAILVGSKAVYAEDLEKKNPIVTLEISELGDIEIELYPEVAPNTVRNFISLVEEGYYDGIIFHRVIPGFMVQGGDPTGTGTGGPGYAIKGEFLQNGFPNQLKHDRGVISMARTSAPNSAGSQFFIMVEKSPHLDGAYAGFGQVVKGMEIVDLIVQAERNSMDKPLDDQKITKATVETFGVEYPKPQKL